MKKVMSEHFKAKQETDKKGDLGLRKVGFGQYCDLTFEQLAKSDDKQHVSYFKWVKRKDNTRPCSTMHILREYLFRLDAPEMVSDVPVLMNTKSATTRSISSADGSIKLTSLLELSLIETCHPVSTSNVGKIPKTAVSSASISSTLGTTSQDPGSTAIVPVPEDLTDADLLASDLVRIVS